MATIRAALDHGINSHRHGSGLRLWPLRGDRRQGIAEAGYAPKPIIATKAGLGWKDGNVYRDASRAHILQEVEDSLRRLRTDYIDIYQVHWPDPSVAVEETAEAMLTLFRAGKDPGHRGEQLFDRLR